MVWEFGLVIYIPWVLVWNFCLVVGLYICVNAYILCIISYFREEETHDDLQIGVDSSDNSDKTLAWRTSLVTLAFSLLIPNIYFSRSHCLSSFIKPYYYLCQPQNSGLIGKDMIRIDHAMLH
ncbi:hypothetical protein BO83DRAFT_224835 [Aspergillus eucalypticola CBS 122712]|uniref:Uncharacterized protein n=1 Tax=Aspergillus eucalypticola (strain CBS 122712 / IBT 29274) TaxID=1448314 RepID=A0A317W0U8_ASPEC|nr:uncharacterized protein BO83DRAFT_224835 [Aspergillus eucalypticola CBS 122712]PWY77770.1 hypothetical protein BO83DRAFT_224835 [Aspergillus eucalypticola CBS 122712]